MTKKKFLSLVPALVIAVLAVSPVAAQAENVNKCEEGGTCPRALVNGSEPAENENVPVMSWGTLQLVNTKLGLITCRNAFGGFIKNPGPKGAGDKRAEGEVNGYAAYACKGPLCELAGEPVEVTPLGQASNPVTKVKETVGRITVPWEGKLLEPLAKTWKLDVGNKLKNEKSIRFRVVCAQQALAAEFTGELSPEGTQGVTIGGTPAEVTFKEAESGELESTVGSGTVKGKVKLFGYSEQQVLSVNNQ
jgi:hypothetical protein